MPSAASVNVTGAAVPITVSVTTAAATLSYPQYRRHPRMGAFAAVVLPLGTFALIAGKRRRKMLSGLFCLVLLGIGGFVGCGGGNATANEAGNSSAPAGGTAQPTPTTSMLTLSGVSGTQTRTVSLMLTVQ
jgi:hypothetical protein